MTVNDELRNLNEALYLEASKFVKNKKIRIKSIKIDSDKTIIEYWDVSDKTNMFDIGSLEISNKLYNKE